MGDKHKLRECHCDDIRCMFCAGGLAYCEVCGGFEGSLTTDCCGRKITEDEESRIYHDANLDFINGEWVNAPNFPRGGRDDG